MTSPPPPRLHAEHLMMIIRTRRLTYLGHIKGHKGVLENEHEVSYGELEQNKSQKQSRRFVKEHHTEQTEFCSHASRGV